MVKLVVLTLALALASAFPIKQLDLSKSVFDELNSSTTTAAKKVQLATNALLPHLRVFFNSTAHAIEVDVGDVAVHVTEPDQVIDSSCDHKVTAEHPTGTGTLDKGTKLQFGLSKINWTEATVFIDGQANADLDIKADVKVELGKHIIHGCTHLGHKTVGIDVTSHGVNGLGMNFTASKAHITKTGSTYNLVFDFDVDVVTIVMTWDVTHIDVSHCKIEILGIKIASYCGLIESAIKKGVNNLSKKTSRVTAPKLAAKLASAIQTAIGSTVTIPLKIS
jgi:hypothetical protein